MLKPFICFIPGYLYQIVPVDFKSHVDMLYHYVHEDGAG